MSQCPDFFICLIYDLFGLNKVSTQDQGSKVFIAPDIERLTQTLHNSPTAQTNDDVKLSMENASPADSLQLKQNLMSLPESDKTFKE